jgi:Mrp family chromosome partitioning ATPase
MLTDATLLAAVADGTIVVVAAGHTRSAALRQAVDGLSRATDSLLGVVLNKVGPRGPHSYLGYYRYHRYYSSDDGTRKQGRRRGETPRPVREPVGPEEGGHVHIRHGEGR